MENVQKSKFALLVKLKISKNRTMKAKSSKNCRECQMFSGYLKNNASDVKSTIYLHASMCA